MYCTKVWEKKFSKFFNFLKQKKNYYYLYGLDKMC